MKNEMIVQPQKGMDEELATRHSLLWQLFMEAYRNRDIEKAYSLILLNPEIMANGLTVIYHSLPDEKKFSLPLECYTQHGDRMPAVRRYVRQARKFMPPEKRMPAEFLEKPYIEVYRAGEEPISLAKSRISWTTDLDVARWIYDRNKLFGKKCHLYKAKINPRSIIWYTDAREEKEVMQYRSVREIEELPR